MANPVEAAAFVSVGRACGFAGLGVLCIVLGLSYDPALAAKAGAVLSLVICLILLLHAWLVHKRPYKRTETWLILRKDDRPPVEVAQRLVSTALREAYLFFAHKASVFTMLFAGMSVMFQLGQMA
jgi:multisubunit Na+/H+ antiporter MnhB subunit